MSMLSSLLPFLLLLTSFTTPSSSSSTEAFVFSSCSQAKFTQGSTYESGVNSLLTSIVNCAMFSSYNNLTTPATSSQDTPIYGLFQCRGDLAAPDCSRCVAQAVSQIGSICPYSTGGALQLDGCFVKYDDSNFLGVEDMTLVIKKCEPSIGFTSDVLTRRDAVLAYLETSGGMFRTFKTSSSSDLQGTAQCVGDLSASGCQDCLSNAIGRLRVECGPAKWGQIYLAKCFALYSEDGDYSQEENGDHKSKNDGKLRKIKLRKIPRLFIKIIVPIATLLGTGGAITLSYQIHVKIKLVKKKTEIMEQKISTILEKQQKCCEENRTQKCPTGNSRPKCCEPKCPAENLQPCVVICESRILPETCACDSDPGCTIQ